MFSKAQKLNGSPKNLKCSTSIQQSIVALQYTAMHLSHPGTSSVAAQIQPCIHNHSRIATSTSSVLCNSDLYCSSGPNVLFLQGVILWHDNATRTAFTGHSNCCGLFTAHFCDICRTALKVAAYTIIRKRKWLFVNGYENNNPVSSATEYFKLVPK